MSKPIRETWTERRLFRGWSRRRRRKAKRLAEHLEREFVVPDLIPDGTVRAVIPGTLPEPQWDD